MDLQYINIGKGQQYYTAILKIAIHEQLCVVCYVTNCKYINIIEG